MDRKNKKFEEEFSNIDKEERNQSNATPRPATRHHPHQPQAKISRHIKNVLDDGELDREVVVAFFATTAKHGAIEGKTMFYPNCNM